MCSGPLSNLAARALPAPTGAAAVSAPTGGTGDVTTRNAMAATTAVIAVTNRVVPVTLVCIGSPSFADLDA